MPPRRGASRGGEFSIRYADYLYIQVWRLRRFVASALTMAKPKSAISKKPKSAKPAGAKKARTAPTPRAHCSGCTPGAATCEGCKTCAHAAPMHRMCMAFCAPLHVRAPPRRRPRIVHGPLGTARRFRRPRRRPRVPCHRPRQAQRERVHKGRGRRGACALIRLTPPRSSRRACAAAAGPVHRLLLEDAPDAPQGHAVRRARQGARRDVGEAD